MRSQERSHLTGPKRFARTCTDHAKTKNIIFAFLYKKTEQEQYRKAVEKCADYLLSEQARPMNASFYCRTNVNKDLSNGTIGQAWAIEGLVSAYKITKQKVFLEIHKLPEVLLFAQFYPRSLILIDAQVSSPPPDHVSHKEK